MPKRHWVFTCLEVDAESEADARRLAETILAASVDYPEVKRHAIEEIVPGPEVAPSGELL